MEIGTLPLAKTRFWWAAFEERVNEEVGAPRDVPVDEQVGAQHDKLMDEQVGA